MQTLLCTSGGYLQYRVTPTTRSPSPRAYKVSVTLGASDTIRRHGALGRLLGRFQTVEALLGEVARREHEHDRRR